MTNEEFRSYARKRGVRHYELAEALHIHETTLSKILRYEMDADLLKKFLKMVDVIAESKGHAKVQKSKKMNLEMQSMLNKAVDEVIGTTEKQEVTAVKKTKREKTARNNIVDSATDSSDKEWLEFLGVSMQQQ